MIVGVNKPTGMTSHDVVDLVRKISGVKKVGHGGTLDPMASGVLVIGVEREATRQLSTFLGGEKEYVATARLDGISDTDDADGLITLIDVKRRPSRSEVDRIMNEFTGEIQQIPPKYSAVKIKGKPAYKYARAGKNVTLKSRDVDIKNINVEEYEWPRLRFRVTTGSGVYVRSLARDIGRALNTGGYLIELVRTRVGDVLIGDAVSLSKLEEYLNNGNNQ